MPDNLSREQRSYCMSRVKGKNTLPERIFYKALNKAGIRCKRNYNSLPGKPDIVCLEKKFAIFIDGDFWHGYRFPQWKNNLSEFWIKKIDKNRKRDLKNFRKLRVSGWKVCRVWEHEIEKNIDEVLAKVLFRMNAP